MKHKALVATVLLAALSGFAKTFDVDISTGRPAASNEAYYHGETIEFRAVRGRSVVTNIEYSCVYYQTNGMDSVWWHTDGLVFHPTNDVGAASYRFFLEGRDDLGRDWHANGLLRLLPSPGFTPNEITMPVATLDFSGIEVFNAPWTDPDYSTNNAALVETIEATAPVPGNYAAVSNAAVHAAITNALQDTALESHASQLSQLSQSLDTITYASPIMPARLCMDYPESSQDVEPVNRLGYYFFMFDDMPGAPRIAYQKDKFLIVCEFGEAIGRYDSFEGRVDFDMPDAPFGSYIFKVTMSPVATIDKINRTSQALATTNALQDAAIESNKVSIASNADSISSLSDSISTLSNTTSTVFSGLAALADEARPAINGYARLYSFVTGSTNANFVVTNYQLTAEAEAARTHFDPSDPELDFSTVPPSLRLEDASSGTNRVVVDTRDWVVWYYAQKIGGAMAEAVSTAVDTCRAWCGFTATGLENPAPDTLVVDVPNIWLMAGKTFEKHIAGSNAVWIIRSSGVVMPISDNSQSAGGFLELTDAFGTPYIRFNKSESYFVDPAAEGVEYDSATGAWLVTYTTTTRPKGGANAVLEGSTTYPGKAILKDEDDPDCPATITWTGSANNWVMHAVPKQIDGAVPPKMFFAAVVEVQGQDYIEYLRPMSVPSLMFNGATYAPTVNGNKLEFIAQ